MWVDQLEFIGAQLIYPFRRSSIELGFFEEDYAVFEGSAWPDMTYWVWFGR